MNCPDCNNFLKETAYKCLCGWRSKPKEEESKYTCKKCDHTRFLFRCGPSDDPFYLCDQHRQEFKENLKEARIEREAIQVEGNISEDKHGNP